MRIGIVSSRFDARDIGLLSGSPHFMVKSLEAHVGEVVYLPYDRRWSTRGIRKAAGAINRLSFALLHRRIAPDHNRLLSQHRGRFIDAATKKAACDILFAPVASDAIAYLKTDLPIIYATDQNWANAVGYYPHFSSVFAFAAAGADRIEAAAIARSAAVLYPSRWAARTAIRHYRANPEKIHCVPWGANFYKDEIPSRDSALRRSLDSPIRLLWIGVDWRRKGGSIARECLLALLERGIDAKLTVCGCIPPARDRHPRIEVIPFLSKRDPFQRQSLSRLFLEAHFFLLPSMADAAPSVLREASAHGLPSLVRNTGGIGDLVTHGLNGYLLSPEAGGNQYAQRILETTRNPHTYRELVSGSRAAFEEHLNWDSWGKAVRPVFERCLRVDGIAKHRRIIQ